MVLRGAVTVLGFSLLSGVCSLQWSAGPEDGAPLYVCEGEGLTLPWTITPDRGEQVIDIQWLFQGHSNRTIAVYTQATLFPSPSHCGRVQFLANAGISVSHVTQGDAGNYTVLINMADGSGRHVTHSQTVLLHVASVWSARQDASLEVEQQPTVVYDQLTNDYHVQLKCVSHSQRPHGVIWTTPSLETLQSSRTDGNTFILLLALPVTGGNYTCRLLPDSPTASCLPRGDPALRGATVFVDDVKLRFSVLEAKQKATDQKLRAEISDLKAENGDIKTENSQLSKRIQSLETGQENLRAENAALKNENRELSQRLRSTEAGQEEMKTENTFLKTQIHHLQVENNTTQTKNNQLIQRVNSMEDLTSKRVAFHARLSSSQQLSRGNSIIPTVVSINQGNAYDPSSGRFTAPYSGVYFFTATAGSDGTTYSDVDIVVEGSWVSVIKAYAAEKSDMGTCSYIGHLERGQQVWLVAAHHDNMKFDKYVTTFTGFLVSAD